MNDINSLSHTRWNCKYHIVFAAKIPEKGILQRETTGSGKDPERAVRVEKKDKNSRGRSVPDHVHMLLEIPPKYSVSVSWDS